MLAYLRAHFLEHFVNFVLKARGSEINSKELIQLTNKSARVWNFKNSKVIFDPFLGQNNQKLTKNGQFESERAGGRLVSDSLCGKKKAQKNIFLSFLDTISGVFL